MGLTGVGAPVTLPAPPLLICTLPATFPEPSDVALPLIVTAPGTIGAVTLEAAAFTPVPIVPCPYTTPATVLVLVAIAVLAVPVGPGVGVATLTACPELLVCPDAEQSPAPATTAAAHISIENLIPIF
jgi:hypothetical protein